MANERIRDILDYIDTPTSERDRGRTDPYYYGMTEQQWLSGQNQLFDGLQSGRISPALAQEILRNEQRMGANEIDLYIKDALKRDRQGYFKNNKPRAVEYGTAHVNTGELLASKVLNASGKHTVPNNSGNTQDTDLKSMIDSVRKLVDVQYRINPGGPTDVLSLGILQGLDYNTGLKALANAPSNRKLERVIERVIDVNDGDVLADKLLQVPGQPGVRPGLAKDMLITGHIDSNKVSNLHGVPNHGNYNATAPDSFTMIDMKKLGQGLQDMTVGQLRDANVRPIRQAKDKLKLQVPFDLVQRLAQRSDIIDPEINYELRKHYT